MLLKESRTYTEILCLVSGLNGTGVVGQLQHPAVA